MPYADPRDLCRVFLEEFRARELSRDASHWAERNLVFGSKDPFPGPYKLDSFPPTIEIMKRMSLSDPCPEVWIVGSAQSGKSTSMLAVIGLLADEMPCNIGLYVPDDKLALKWRNDKLEPLFMQTATLRHLTERTKERTHNATMIELPPRAGSIAIMNASSSAAYRQQTLRVVFVDDMDACRPPGEGDIPSLARARTQLFTIAGRKNIFVSTPTTNQGPIWQGWEASSMNEYWTPCPYCDEFQVFSPVNWRWTRGQPSTIHLMCVKCHGPIYQWQLPPLLVRGEWRARVPELLGRREGFRFNWAISPPSLADWTDYATAHEAAQRALDLHGDDTKMQVAYNTMRGEPWSPHNDKKLDELARTVLDRARSTPRFIPSQMPGALLWTIGTDVQRDRLESCVVAWGKGKECWVVERAVHEGRHDELDVWQRWADWACSRNPKISAACVDISFEREATGQSSVRTSDRLSEMLPLFLDNAILLWGVKGASDANKPAWPRAPVGPGNLGSNYKMNPVIVGVSRIKTWVRSGLEKDMPSGPGVIHLDNTTTTEHVRQLLSERRWRIGDKSTANSRPWVRVRRSQAQEHLDYLVYAVAAVEGLCALPGDAGQQFSRLLNASHALPSQAPRPVAVRARPAPLPGLFGGGNPMGL